MNRRLRKNKRSKYILPTSSPHRHNAHKLAWGVIFTILIVTATITLIKLFQPINSINKPTNDNSGNININSEDIKENNTRDVPGKTIETEAEETKTTTSDGTPLKNEGSDPNSSDNLTGAITFSGVSGRTLMIRANIDQYLISGTCDLTLTSKTVEGVSYTMQAPIVPSVSSSTCDGFDYDDVHPGNYSIKINLTSGGKTGTLTGEVGL